MIHVTDCTNHCFSSQQRAQRWGEEMDEMAMERMRLSHLLLEALCRIEQESGIFMIKPILSYQGR